MQSLDTSEYVSIVGARPQFIKLGPVARALDAIEGVRHRVIHTGQHYDTQMSAVFFEQLALPKPELNLDVGSGGHGEQTGTMLARLEAQFEARRPRVVIVYGDTNSTLAATLAASKLHVPVAHIEAGLRSFNRRMPEEINRIVADHCGDRLYAPTPTAMKNLENENLSDRAVFSGDVMRDAVHFNREIASADSQILEELGIEAGQFGVLTVHRPVNTTREALAEILDGVGDLARKSMPVVFPVHPRTRPLLDAMDGLETSGIRLIEPVSYLDMLRLLDAAAIVMTDSGGVQKEAAFLETPCITLREETEWVETLELGVNRLVGRDGGKIRTAIAEMIDSKSIFDDRVRRSMDEMYGDGHAAAGIVADLVSWSAQFCQETQQGNE